jgi:hypothetical protein
MTIANPTAAAGVRKFRDTNKHGHQNADGAQQFTKRGDADDWHWKRRDAGLPARDETVFGLADLRQPGGGEDRGQRSLQGPQQRIHDGLLRFDDGSHL